MVLFHQDGDVRPPTEMSSPFKGESVRKISKKRILSAHPKERKERGGQKRKEKKIDLDTGDFHPFKEASQVFTT